MGRSASSARPSSASMRVGQLALARRSRDPCSRRSRHSVTPRVRARSATRRWSRTVMPANSSMRWNVRAMPRRARRKVGVRVTSRSSNSTRPWSGRRKPERQLKKVVLPAPFGPIRPDELAGVDLDRHVAQRGDAGEALADVAGLEQRVIGLLPTATRASVSRSRVSGCPGRAVDRSTAWSVRASVGSGPR